MEEKIHLFRFNPVNRFLAGNQSLLDHLHCDPDFCLGGSFPITGLEHPQGSTFDGELHVLHVAVMLFQLACNFTELVINFREFCFQLTDRFCHADSRHHIFSLGIHQKIALEFVPAVGSIAGHGDSGS